MEQLLLSDEGLAVVVPILVYWVYCGLHVVLGQSMYMDRYRLHPSAHEDSKNYVSKRQVIGNVLKQQLVQVTIVAMVFKLTGGRSTSSTTTEASSYLKLACQILVAMVFFDVWQYACHRTMHASRFLYRNLHSWHHRLVVPYAFGALYGHPLEGFVADTVGGTAAFLVSGMSPRASVFFFSLCTVKVVDNHCGLSLLPCWDRLGLWNSAAYHDVHHQLRGGQYNFSQLFFVVWDRVFGTHMPFVIEDRAGGGGMLQVRAPGLDYRSK
ncbi:Sphinganine C4-monooxygenase 2 [Zea mays]|uniref:aldehyde oxygenase (deformylating) n=1 Tax=Zea mays TaxID=4577 RepID=A0A3L6ECD3_MAIZE|nr:Sphinganine C4-monooxygenase 2 [Zea mays]